MSGGRLIIKTGVIVVAHGEREIEECEQEIDAEQDELADPQARMITAEVTDQQRQFALFVRGDCQVEDSQPDEDRRGCQEGGRHGPVAQGLHGQDIPAVPHHGLHPQRTGTCGESLRGAQRIMLDLVVEVNMVEHQQQQGRGAQSVLDVAQYFHLRLL